MSYQSEAALEAKLIKRLSSNGYSPVKISDTDALELNFRRQLEKYNGVSFSDEEFLRIRNHLDGGSVFEKALKLRDRYELIRDSGILHVSLFNYIQLFIISNGVNTKYFANNRQMSSKQIIFWTDRKNKRYTKLDEFTEQFL